MSNVAEAILGGIFKLVGWSLAIVIALLIIALML